MRLNYTNKEALHSNNTIPDKNKVNDTDMNSIKNAVNQMSMYTKLSSNNDVWEFPGYEGTLIVGSIIPLEIEASTNPSGNASIKIGDTTYSVKDENGNSISAVGFEGLYYFVFNGTNLILKSFGVSDYNSLSNQPQINGIILTGNKSSNDLGLASSNDLNNLLEFESVETDTGKVWIDGKTIYRKCFSNPASTTTFDHGISNLGEITDYGGTILRNENVDGGTIQTPFPALNSDPSYSLFFNFVSKTKIYLVKGANIQANTVKIWLEYTKAS